MRGDELHGCPAGSHEARVVGTEEVEVGPERYGLQLQFAQGLGERLEFVHGRVEEEGHLHPLEADSGNSPGFLLEIGGGIALEHHAQADVVLGWFACEQFRESACGDSGRSHGPEKMPS